MLKKACSFFLVLCLLLSGCGSASAENSSTVSSVFSSDSVIPDVEESSIVSELDLADFTAPETGRIEQTVLFENDQVIIRAESVDTDSEATYISVTVENLLDKDLVLSCPDAYINGYLITSSFNAEIPAKETLLTGVDFSNALLNACDIDKIGEIKFSLTGFAYDSGDVLFETDLMSVTTDLQGTFTQTVDTDGTVLWESNDVSFILRSHSHDEDFNPVLVMLIVNRSNRAVFADLETSGSSANSFFIDFGYMLQPQTQTLALVQGLDDQGNLLESLEDISYHFMLSDGETWEDIATSEELTF